MTTLQHQFSQILKNVTSGDVRVPPPSSSTAPPPAAGAGAPSALQAAASALPPPRSAHGSGLGAQGAASQTWGPRPPSPSLGHPPAAGHTAFQVPPGMTEREQYGDPLAPVLPPPSQPPAGDGGAFALAVPAPTSAPGGRSPIRRHALKVGLLLAIVVVGVAVFVLVKRMRKPRGKKPSGATASPSSGGSGAEDEMDPDDAAGAGPGGGTRDPWALDPFENAGRRSPDRGVAPGAPQYEPTAPYAAGRPLPPHVQAATAGQRHPNAGAAEWQRQRMMQQQQQQQQQQQMMLMEQQRHHGAQYPTAFGPLPADAAAGRPMRPPPAGPDYGDRRPGCDARPPYVVRAGDPPPGTATAYAPSQRQPYHHQATPAVALTEAEGAYGGAPYAPDASGGHYQRSPGSFHQQQPQQYQPHHQQQPAPRYRGPPQHAANTGAPPWPSPRVPEAAPHTPYGPAPYQHQQRHPGGSAEYPPQHVRQQQHGAAQTTSYPQQQGPPQQRDAQRPPPPPSAVQAPQRDRRSPPADDRYA